MIKVNLKEQLGFTLIELLVVLSLLGIISGVIALSLGMTLKTTNITAAQNMSVSQVHMAGSWISKDVQSCNGTITVGTSPLWRSIYRYNLNCVDIDRVDYLITDGVLTRTVYNQAGSLISQMQVAQFIDSIGTVIDPPVNNIYKLTIVAIYNNTPGYSQVYQIIRKAP